MLKDGPSLLTIEEAIKHHNGTFAGFQLDPDSVHSSELSSKETKTSSKKGVNFTMIVGALVGFIIVGVAIGGTIYCLIKKPRNRAAQQGSQDYSNHDRFNDRLQLNNLAYDNSDPPTNNTEF
ncbi:hypothetical protein NP493_903g01004 [Ridgeia piscesae]|uniref:Uncharacterized protein n=1 Tax=Ridgeia piscesae TaxID=27915 RepID=A0AAD9NLW0_RIDPI|nr:hypothetical protein NP493_903g01004 [Ridgeia piscesae]